jgi:hypothetical protein
MSTDTNQQTAVTITTIDPEIIGNEIERVESSIPREAAVALRDSFAPHFEQAVALVTQAATITNPSDPTQQKLARTVRLELKKNRCAVEAERKTLKAESLARGKFIDGVAGYIQTVLCEPVEERLEAIEKHAERMEAARIAALIETRKARLIAEAVDPAPYNLAAMDDETFEIILGNARRAKAEADEAARKAEADRVAKEQAEAAERAKAEAEAREAKAKAEAEQKAIDAANKERERIEAEAKAAADDQARREADKAHKGAVNRTALAALIDGGVSEDAAKKCIELVAKKAIPGMKMEY